MEFEYDPIKSQTNLKKHGLSLEMAKILWETPSAEFEARSDEENRIIRVGQIWGKFYSCIYTVRNEAVRFISLRRSRENEENFFKENINDEKNRKAN